MYADEPAALELEEEKTHTVWLDFRDVSLDETDLLSAACNAGLTDFLVSRDFPADIKLPTDSTLAIYVDSADQVAELDRGDVVISDDLEALKAARAAEFETGYSTRIHDRASMDEIIEVLQTREWLSYGFVELEDETNIPLELLIAEFQGEPVELVKVVEGRVDAEVAIDVMEVGIDGVVATPESPDTVFDLADVQRDVDDIELDTLEVTEVEHIGRGTRTCVDATSLMSQQEGMLVGSKSAGGIFVCSETHPLPYMDLRPFRVNAGAAHSYIWTPEGKTKYLSELTVGDEVLCVDTDGNTRSVTVGRSKTEERPLIVIKAASDDQEINVVLQDDWHVRVMGADGEPINVTELEPGDEVLGQLCEPGRHVGVKIQEDILEQ